MTMTEVKQFNFKYPLFNFSATFIICKNYTTSSHAPTSHAPSSHVPSSHAPSSHAPSSHAHKPPSDQQSDPNPPPTSYSGTSTLPTSGMQQARIYIQSSFYSFIVCLGKSMLRPIIILFFYRLFRKVYAMSNGMYLFLPIDRFLRMRSRNLLMYLDPLVSLRFSSFELAYIPYSLFRPCRINLVSLPHVSSPPFSQLEVQGEL